MSDASTFLVLVTGHAAAGKTTLAPKLAEELGAIWISRDTIHSRRRSEGSLERLSPETDEVATAPRGVANRSTLIERAGPTFQIACGASIREDIATARSPSLHADNERCTSASLSPYRAMSTKRA